MIVVLIAAPIAWVTTGVLLASLMARRGYDRTAWLVVGLLFGPVATVFAVLETLWGAPRPADLIEAGRPGPGTVDLLVVLSGDDTETATLATQALAGRLRRLALVRVLPLDGAKSVEQQAADQLRRAAAPLGRRRPDLALLFGVRVQAITEFAVARGFHVVLTDADAADLSAALSAAGIVLLPGPSAFRFHFSPVRTESMTGAAGADRQRS